MHYARCSEGCEILAVLGLACASLQIIRGLPKHLEAFSCKVRGLQSEELLLKLGVTSPE